MEDTMDWEAEWNKLVNKARVSETQLAGSTQLQVQDFRRWWDCYTPLSLFTEAEVRTLTDTLKALTGEH